MVFHFQVLCATTGECNNNTFVFEISGVRVKGVYERREYLASSQETLVSWASYLVLGVFFILFCTNFVQFSIACKCRFEFFF